MFREQLQTSDPSGNNLDVSSTPSRSKRKSKNVPEALEIPLEDASTDALDQHQASLEVANASNAPIEEVLTTSQRPALDFRLGYEDLIKELQNLTKGLMAKDFDSELSQ